MLRVRFTRVLPPQTCPCQTQRLIWSRASDFMTWLGILPTDKSDSFSSVTKQSSDKRNSPPDCDATNYALRPQQPPDTALPSFQQLVDMKKQISANRALKSFSQGVKYISSSTQLQDVWQVVSQCRPFVLHKKEPLQVRLASVEDLGRDCPWFLQIVPGDVFAQLSVGTSCFMFVGSMGEDLGNGDVVVANESIVLRNLIEALHEMNEHKLVVAFIEAYDRDRSVWLQEHQLRTGAEMAARTFMDEGKESEPKLSAARKQLPIEKVTQLSNVVYSYYLRSLAALKQSKKILRLFEDGEHQLEKICNDIRNLYLLLNACSSEKNGELARRAIDTMTQCNPATVIPLGCYEIGIRANFRDIKGGEQGLLNAIHLAGALRAEGGYILKPNIWSELVTMSLTLDRTDLALEVFKTYPRHYVLKYQGDFRRVLRTACCLANSTAIEMMQFCWGTHDTNCSQANTLLDERNAYKDAISFNNPGVTLGNVVSSSNVPAQDKEDETDLLNMMLMLMLKHGHPVSHITQVVDTMEASRSKGGALVLRKAVVRMLDFDIKDKKMSPCAAVKSSLKFWKKRPSVLHGQLFLVHLLLEECTKRQWDDECEFLVNYMLNRDVARVPINAVVKLMETNEIRGRFEVNAEIGDKILQKCPPEELRKLRDNFYERCLMSYFRLEQFDKVRKQYAKFNLGKRYPHNEVIRKIVQDAAAQ